MSTMMLRFVNIGQNRLTRVAKRILKRIGGEMRSPSYTIDVPGGEDRFKELILYISTRCQYDRGFGAVKLNKILWKSDFMAYAQLGKPITGEAYRKLQWGPTPRRMKPLQNELVEQGRAAIDKRTVFVLYESQVTVPLSDPDLQLFTAEQIAIVDVVIDELAGLSAAEVSDMSHGKAWEAATFGADIPYESVFLAEESSSRDLLAQNLWELQGSG